jgi:hypothetical protein
MTRSFARFQRKVLRAIAAAEPAGINAATLQSVLDCGSNLRGALFYLEASHMIEHVPAPTPFARLTEKGARAIDDPALISATATPRGRRRFPVSSPLAPAPSSTSS